MQTFKEKLKWFLSGVMALLIAITVLYALTIGVKQLIELILRLL